MLRTTFFTVLAITLASCSGMMTADNSPEVIRTTASSNGQHVRLLLTERHYLELEPCGCSMHPMGGLQRETNALHILRNQDTKGTIWTLAIGATFAPPPAIFQADLVDRYATKAGFMLDGLKLNNTSLLSVTADDMILGVDRMRALEKKAGFPFISANLFSADGKQRLFKPYVTLDTGGVPVVFTSVSSEIDPSYNFAPKVKVRPAIETLKEVFATLPKGEKILVMLATLPDKEVREIREAFPEIRMWLGGAQSEAFGGVTQPARDFFHLWLVNQGRSVGALEFDTTKPLKAGWYSPAQVNAAKTEIKKHQTRLAEIEKILKGQLAPTFRKGYEYGVKEEKAAIAHAKKMAALKASDNTTYLYQLLELENTFEEPANEATKIVDKYKTEMRDLAIASEEK